MMKSYSCKNVVDSSRTAHNFSRHELLHWINDILGVKLKKVEALCSGSEYCQIMHMIFPGCISLKKINFQATREHEYVSNLKLLQKAFRVVSCSKCVPIERLIERRFQENFEFLQWFRRFYDANVEPAEHPLTPANTVLKKSSVRVHAAVGPVTSTPKESLVEKDLRTRIAKLMEKADTVEKEKDYYLDKLKNIEKLCGEFRLNATIDRETVKAKILDELYARKEGFVEPDEAAC